MDCTYAPTLIHTLTYLSLFLIDTHTQQHLYNIRKKSQ